MKDWKIETICQFKASLRRRNDWSNPLFLKYII